jgi:hypothetical protein
MKKSGIINESYIIEISSIKNYTLYILLKLQFCNIPVNNITRCCVENVFEPNF